ncbi:MAG: hypothetical protein AAGG80_06535 [Pseudomonadota bacterium]
MKKFTFYGLITFLVMWCSAAFAEGNWNDITSNTTSVFLMMGGMMRGIAYVIGFSFIVASLVKFVDHKQNPSQSPLFVPCLLLLFGTVLIILPFIAKLAGE